ncbi:hypothetical protein C8R44DRAFT_729040 [Mycena epipterygia]|nr:hypothetical protein C8R44DRAFT_729040 [Mycena epipterygia]
MPRLPRHFYQTQLGLCDDKDEFPPDSELKEQYVDHFVTDILSDAAKIRGLKLTPEEWARVDTFPRLLGVRLFQLLDHFSCLLTRFKACGEGPSGTIPSPHRAIPALEALQHTGSKSTSKPEYVNYASVLREGAEEIDQYYQKTACSTVQVMVIVLDPTQKGRHFQTHWRPELAKEAQAITSEKIFAEHWPPVQPNNPH